MKLSFSPAIIFSLLNQVLKLINGLINGLSPKTATTIKQSYFLVVFILLITGTIIGINMGREAARIKSPPLAETVNDAFEFDIKKEKSGGDFDSMLESELINEAKASRHDKIDFPSREKLEPEYEGGIIEPKTEKRGDPDTEIRTAPMEGNYRPLGLPESQVEALKKIPDNGKSEQKTDAIMPMRPDTDKTPAAGNSTVPVIEKNDSGKNNTDRSGLEPLKDNTGIIEK